MPEHDETIEVHAVQEDTTEPTPVVSAPTPSPRNVTIPVEHLEVATEIDVPRPSLTPTPQVLTPVPRESSAGDPVLALAKPKSSASFVDRKYRLPTESEIKAAIEGTPTDEVPVID